MEERWIVLAKDHEGRPFGSARCRDREEAERVAASYERMTRVGSVSARPVREVQTKGNGRFR